MPDPAWVRGESVDLTALGGYHEFKARMAADLLIEPADVYLNGFRAVVKYRRYLAIGESLPEQLDKLILGPGQRRMIF